MCLLTSAMRVARARTIMCTPAAAAASLMVGSSQIASVVSFSTARASATWLGAESAALLQDASLLSSQGHDALQDDAFPVCNPAQPDTIVARVPNRKQSDAETAIAKSAQALASWRDGTTGQQRSQLLTKWSRLIQENANDIATIMTLESGKPLQESLGEVNYGVSFLDYYAAEAVRPTSAGGGFLVPTPFSTTAGNPRGRVMAIHQAVGVTAMITPWNFPMAMITRKVGPALAAGCTAVVKPSERTPLTAVALETLAHRAGIPPDVFSLVTGDSDNARGIGKEFCRNPRVQKISFTGSTAVGKLLMQQSSDSVKRLSLELGGNAPFVVLEDADIDLAVEAAVASKFRNAGQTCVCADRFLVHASVQQEFVAKLVQATNQNVRVGDGMDPQTTMGPLITPQAAASVDEKVQEALQEGATCLAGGTRGLEEEDESGSSPFYPPTILTNVSKESRIFRTETFGPVAAIRSFDSEDEALEICNDSNVGLASYFCTKDMSRAFRFGSKLECGIVGINDGIISTAAAPFGGVKESGLGREGSALGIAEYLETKYMFLNV